MMHMKAVLLGVMIAQAGCEHGVKVRGVVEVSREIQQQFTPTRQGVVAIVTTIPKTGTIGARLAVLCGPSNEPLKIAYELDEHGCKKQATLHAWVAAVAGPLLQCGLVRERHVDVLPDDVVAYASSVIFEGNTSSAGCSNGDAKVDLVLEPRQP